jgi:hypothetical protein
MFAFSIYILGFYIAREDMELLAKRKFGEAKFAETIARIREAAKEMRETHRVLVYLFFLSYFFGLPFGLLCSSHLFICLCLCSKC